MTDPRERRIVLVRGKSKVTFIWYTDTDSVVVDMNSIWNNGRPGCMKRTLERTEARKLWHSFIDRDGYKKIGTL